MAKSDLVGKRIRFIGFGEADSSPLVPGDEGTVSFVDAVGTIHVDWDNGSRLGLLTQAFPSSFEDFKPDRYEVIS